MVNYALDRDITRSVQGHTMADIDYIRSQFFSGKKITKIRLRAGKTQPRFARWLSENSGEHIETITYCRIESYKKKGACNPVKPSPRILAAIDRIYSHVLDDSPENNLKSSEEEKGFTGMENVQTRFKGLVIDWKDHREKFPVLSFTDIFDHPAYKEIIEMGNSVLPLILQELQQKPDHWFVALRKITGVNPVKDHERGKVRLMADAWIEWGIEQGLLK